MKAMCARPYNRFICKVSLVGNLPDCVVKACDYTDGFIVTCDYKYIQIMGLIDAIVDQYVANDINFIDRLNFIDTDK